MAIIITSSIAKNVLQELKPDVSAAATKAASRWTMAACLALAMGLAVFQPKLVQWIIFFSIGGLEAATFGPILLGLNWKRGNRYGALAAIGCGVVVYALANTVVPQLRLWGTHPSLVAVTAAVITFIAVSLLSPQPGEDIVQTFWGKKVP
jgi:sodium/pantothenate symporter